MSPRHRQIFAGLIGLALLGPARAEVVEVPDDQRYIMLAFDKVARARGLTADQAKAALNDAAAWYFAGPCKGDTRKLPGPVIGAMQLMADPKPEQPFDAAVLELTAIFAAKDFGRTTPKTCELALGIAKRAGRP